MKRFGFKRDDDGNIRCTIDGLAVRFRTVERPRPLGVATSVSFTLPVPTNVRVRSASPSILLEMPAREPIEVEPAVIADVHVDLDLDALDVIPEQHDLRDTGRNIHLVPAVLERDRRVSRPINTRASRLRTPTLREVVRYTEQYLRLRHQPFVAQLREVFEDNPIAQRTDAVIHQIENDGEDLRRARFFRPLDVGPYRVSIQASARHASTPRLTLDDLNGYTSWAVAIYGTEDVVDPGNLVPIIASGKEGVLDVDGHVRRRRRMLRREEVLTLLGGITHPRTGAPLIDEGAFVPQRRPPTWVELRRPDEPMVCVGRYVEPDVVQAILERLARVDGDGPALPPQEKR